MIGDLHCHTRLSNGSCGIDDVVFYAKRAGLDFLAITDQDTMDGCQRAAVLGKRYGLRVVPGVELSCREEPGGQEIHILCYLPAKPDRMQGLMAKTLESRNAAGRRMARRVMRDFPVTEEHILRCAAGSKALYPAHIMQALLDLGYDCQTHGALYGKLFGEEGVCLVHPELPEIGYVLETVHSAGGIAVLAHPATEGQLELLERLASQGVLHGVEACHPGLGGWRGQQVLELADTYKLLKTGGSGFHGSWTGTPNPLASSVVTASCLSSMFRIGKMAAVK